MAHLQKLWGIWLGQPDKRGEVYKALRREYGQRGRSSRSGWAFAACAGAICPGQWAVIRIVRGGKFGIWFGDDQAAAMAQCPVGRGGALVTVDPKDQLAAPEEPNFASRPREPSN